MREFRGRVAVITGGAGTLGMTMAKRFGAAGMKIVLADLKAELLDPAVATLRENGIDAIGVPTDVANAASVATLAERARAAFGAVHLVANNAGVAPLGAVWESSLADWQWALGVNLWGVIHGVRTFVPIMLAQGEDAHIVNVASVAGLISPPGMGVYNVSKHAVVALSETLHHDLARASDKVRCSVLCPAFFPSGISDSERSRPAELKNDEAPSDQQLALQQMMVKAVRSGKISADEIAELVFEAVKHERFYVLPHARIKPAIQARMEDVLAEANPRDPMKVG